MDNIIQKFYSNGKAEEQKYTQFGAFSNSLLKNSSPNLNFKTTGLSTINIGTINPSTHNIETTTHIPKTPNQTPPNIQQAFLQPKKLIFNGTNDLVNKTLIKNFEKNYNDVNTFNKSHQNIPSLNTLKQNMNLEAKKNATKVQMMEEKMKNLELKSQRLEVINEFFFDMFENNLVKEELKRQKNIKEEKESKFQENDEEESEGKKKRKKSKKNKKKNLKIDPYELQTKNQEELDTNEFKKKTKKIARNYLNTVKNDLGLFLVEEKLKKNEELQDITEDIINLKGDLLNQLERMQMIQNMEMKKIAYCLQNSGDDKIENLATRLFGDNILKNTEVNNPTSFNNTNAIETKSILNPRGSVFHTLLRQRRPSIEMEEDNNNNTNRQSLKRHSLFDNKEKNNDDKVIVSLSKRQSFIDKERNEREKADKSKRQSFIKIIPEEKNENEN